MKTVSIFGGRLKQANLVVVFYRGSWCPFCNFYLRNLQKNMTQIKAADGKAAGNRRGKPSGI